MHTCAHPLPFEMWVQTHGRTRSRLPGFLVASIVLHAALALSGAVAFQLAGQHETVLSINFDAPNNMETPRAANAGARAPASSAELRKSETVASASTPAPTHIAVTHAPTSASTDTSSTSDHEGAGAEAARARIEAQLFTDLQRHFEYPALARRQGWQGTVQLSFVVEPNGALERIRVARSSGHEVLDRSAVSALRRVEPLPQARHWLDGRALEMNIPVIYRLKDY
jgi:protein TonB